MSDFQVSWGASGADIVLTENDAATDESLVPMILASLFADARLEADPTKPIADQDLRGWWGEEPGDRFGSLLWTLRRSKQIDSTKSRAIEIVKAALAWMRTDGIARSITVEASFPRRGAMLISVVINRGNAPRWAHLWHASEDISFVAGDVELALQFAA